MTDSSQLFIASVFTRSSVHHICIDTIQYNTQFPYWLISFHSCIIIHWLIHIISHVGFSSRLQYASVPLVTQIVKNCSTDYVDYHMQFTQLEIIIRGPILFSHPQKWWISCQGRSYNTSPTPRSSASATSIMIYTISNPSPHLQSVVHRATWARSACHRDERCNAEQFYI